MGTIPSIEYSDDWMIYYPADGSENTYERKQRL